MKVYRISKSLYADDLSGMGAQLYGGRWNPKGLPMVYTAGSVSLALLEFLAHNLHMISHLDLTLTTIEIPSQNQTQIIDPTSLSSQWQNPFSGPLQTQRIGADFLKNRKSYTLQVPSAIVPLEYNILLNPQHSAHPKIKIVNKITPFSIDSRLFTDLPT